MENAPKSMEMRRVLAYSGSRWIQPSRSRHCWDLLVGIEGGDLLADAVQHGERFALGANQDLGNGTS